MVAYAQDVRHLKDALHLPARPPYHCYQGYFAWAELLFSVVLTVQHRLDSSGMAFFSFCGLSGFCSFCGCLTFINPFFP